MPPIDTVEAQVLAREFLVQVSDFAMQIADLRRDGAEPRDGFIKSLANKKRGPKAPLVDPVRRVRSRWR
jgi:hypothetical protein